MSSDDPPTTKPENKRPRPRPVPGIPGAALPRANVEIRERDRDPRADPTSYPPPRTEVEVADDDAAAVQSMRAPRGRAAKTAAIVGAVGAALAGLVPVLSATLESCQKRQEAQALEAAQRAQAVPELEKRVVALEAAVAALKTVDPQKLEDAKKDIADVAKRVSEAERDITKLYRARPSRSPE
jgi:hypothetical protein